MAKFSSLHVENATLAPCKKTCRKSCQLKYLVLHFGPPWFPLRTLWSNKKEIKWNIENKRNTGPVVMCPEPVLLFKVQKFFIRKQNKCYAYQKQNAPRNKPRGAFIIFIPDTAFQCPYVKR